MMRAFSSSRKNFSFKTDPLDVANDVFPFTKSCAHIKLYGNPHTTELNLTQFFLYLYFFGIFSNFTLFSMFCVMCASNLRAISKSVVSFELSTIDWLRYQHNIPFLSFVFWILFFPFVFVQHNKRWLSADGCLFHFSSGKSQWFAHTVECTKKKQIVYYTMEKLKNPSTTEQNQSSEYLFSSRFCARTTGNIVLHTRSKVIQLSAVTPHCFFIVWVWKTWKWENAFPTLLCGMSLYISLYTFYRVCIVCINQSEETKIYVLHIKTRILRQIQYFSVCDRISTACGREKIW
jgi:hypothetical protein